MVDIELNGSGSGSSQRDLGVGNSSPGTAFIWNPNLILNAPQQFTDAVMDWPAFIQTLRRGFGEASVKSRRKNSAP